MQVRIRIAEGETEQPLLLWDSVWDPAGNEADWQIAGAEETGNIGGLRALAALETAVVLALFSDRHCPDDHPLRKYVDDDPRGWWGDGIDVRKDLGETELGSLLWVLERMPCTDDTVQWVDQIVREALQPLLDQKAVARIDVTAERTGLRAIAYRALLYGRDGKNVYDRRFEIVWDQVSS